MGDEFLVRPRLSRIYYDGKYLAYPLQARDVVARLGLVESALCAFSYFLLPADLDAAPHPRRSRTG